MLQSQPTRRQFLTHSVAGAASVSAWMSSPRKPRAESTANVEVLYPRDRVPVSFVIDDSTCLVNMAHFAMPQFDEAYPGRDDYKKPWWTWPREIPDAFVREFGEWSAEHGVKGKYSIVPYPSCVGWLDRELPGWSRQQLRESLRLVRELMVPNWDIHPEMITHTRVIDLKTGRPFAEMNPATMENSYPRETKSVDELTAYIAYALQILRNCDLPCSGVTTPGGFGNLVKAELSEAMSQAVRDVFAAEIPHYFKYVKDDTTPIVEAIHGRGTDQLTFTVNIPAGTGDWFGGWDGVVPVQKDKYCNEDATSGKIVELIQQGLPAVFLCHWPGLYNNGSKEGFQAFQQIVTAVANRFGDRTEWMTMSEIARHAAAKEFTTISEEDDGLRMQAPFDCPLFTIRTPKVSASITMARDDTPQPQQFQSVPRKSDLRHLTRHDTDDSTTICFNLSKGGSRLMMTAR